MIAVSVIAAQFLLHHSVPLEVIINDLTRLTIVSGLLLCSTQLPATHNGRFLTDDVTVDWLTSLSPSFVTDMTSYAGVITELTILHWPLTSVKRVAFDGNASNTQCVITLWIGDWQSRRLSEQDTRFDMLNSVAEILDRIRRLYKSCCIVKI